ncbi:UDP-N-acetylglucosamine--dolichyl-phosphatN-acetylglucosaminephosphotransferase [Malassezia nana]|uniref:UDP-N-acetylglucosamine--dolichyl-phosphate N-acetylglucosaminephosphotransferase n=1 Tax=Malassezia nana TaxID=180528 RepID=A0AAF0J4F4_9BASI|nr:UDP-N-acetylglucosamine--dolichyl-phosphatN-acetylglucosaminephosphotransferase [Malassezia nana]
MWWVWAAGAGAGLAYLIHIAYLPTAFPTVFAHVLALVERFVQVVQYVNTAYPALMVSWVLSVAAFGATYMVVSYSRSAFVARGISGIDLLKRDLLPPGTVPASIPESLGLPCAALYLLALVVFIPFRYFGADMYGLPTSLAGTSQDSAPGLHQDLASFLSALLSIYSGTLLGFVDDVLDIRWRYKLPIPLLSSIPMLIVYMAGGGSTSVVIPAWPPFLREALQRTSLDLGLWYYLFMMMLATFCTNCINILAGINGVEVGQATVIAISVCLNNALYLDLPAVFRAAMTHDTAEPDPVDILRGLHGSRDLVVRHLFSLHLLLPFIGVSLALLLWNKYPAKVFVGDTYCYFAGMVLVSCGVLGHYSKTLLLFFLPQIFNFVLSCPQLFSLVPCPRHRVPFVDTSTGCLYPSCVRLHPSTSWPIIGLLRLLEMCRCVQLIRHEQGHIVGVTNLTLLNAVLVARGSRCASASSAVVESCMGHKDPALRVPAHSATLRLSERGLWYHVMVIQVMGSLVAFTVRYWLASLLFPFT